MGYPVLFALAGYVLAISTSILSLRMAKLCERLKAEAYEANRFALNSLCEEAKAHARISNALTYAAQLSGRNGAVVKIARMLEK